MESRSRTPTLASSRVRHMVLLRVAAVMLGVVLLLQDETMTELAWLTTCTWPHFFSFITLAGPGVTLAKRYCYRAGALNSATVLHD